MPRAHFSSARSSTIHWSWERGRNRVARHSTILPKAWIKPKNGPFVCLIVVCSVLDCVVLKIPKPTLEAHFANRDRARGLNQYFKYWFQSQLRLEKWVKAFYFSVYTASYFLSVESCCIDSRYTWLYVPRQKVWYIVPRPLGGLSFPLLLRTNMSMWSASILYLYMV